MSPLDPSIIVPVRDGDLHRRSWRDSLVTLSAEAVVSLMLNLAVLTALVQLAFPRVLARSEPQTITVDLVPEPPKAAGGPADKTPPKTPAAQSPAGPAAQNQKTEPKAPPGEPPTPAPEPPAAADTPPPAAADAKPVAPENAETPKAADPSPTPAPIDGDRNPAPRLVAAPEAPKPAETQADKPVTATADTKPADTPHPTEQPPPPAPEALATPTGGADAIPQPSSAVETSHPAPAPSAEEKREAENTAKLAAALPFAQNLPPTFTRTALPGAGDAVVQKFRGAVYGQFRKADDLVDQARTAHLRGQTVVEFSIDDQGALTGLRVAVSSGQPAVDRIAEDIIRRSAPFPPPPPGAPHVFSPAIRLGLDE